MPYFTNIENLDFYKPNNTQYQAIEQSEKQSSTMITIVLILIAVMMSIAIFTTNGFPLLYIMPAFAVVIAVYLRLNSNNDDFGIKSGFVTGKSTGKKNHQHYVNIWFPEEQKYCMGIFWQGNDWINVKEGDQVLVVRANSRYYAKNTSNNNF